MAAGRTVRALYLSSMTVTPEHGGGNATYNLLEPAPDGCELFYATLLASPADKPFPELAGRILTFPGEGRVLAPTLREGRVRKALRGAKRALRLDAVAARANVKNMGAAAITRWVLRQIEELRPDVLVLAPQPTLDVVVGNAVLEKTGLPAVAWFMDDYYADRYSRAELKKLWNRTRRRFAISESMRERFTGLYGGDCGVLGNSIDYPEVYEPPSESPDGRLRVLYAGSLNDYYAPTMGLVLREFEGLGDKVTLDVYTGGELPVAGRDARNASWRKLPLIKPAGLIGRLRDYDVLLLLSNFQREHRTIAETAQASKMAEYMAAGRCILAYGPPYAENVRYLQRHGVGEAVASAEPGVLRRAVLALAEQPERRRALGERAYHFGRERRDRVKNRAALWQVLREVAGPAA